MNKRLAVLCVGVSSLLCADEVQIQDGTVLKGTIRSISAEVIEVETSFAGTVKVDRAQVSTFSTQQPVFVRLASGAVMPGTVSSAAEGSVEIAGVDGTLKAPLTAVRQGWIDAHQDPEILAMEKAAAELKRKWKYQVAAKISGKSGNTDEGTMGAEFSAVLASKEDELKFYGMYDRKDSDGEKTTDERKIGMRYTSYFRDPWGWYVRQEFENDEFENIQLRSVTAGGLSYRFFKEDHKSLSGNAGLSYRSETYEDGADSTENIGLDLGLQHYYRLDDHFEIHNELTYVPSIEDFADYLLVQKSYVDFPLGGSKLWKIRLSLQNDYNSLPKGDREKIDTTYSSSLVAEWN